MRSTTHLGWLTLVAILSLARAARAEPGAVLVSGTAPARHQVIASSAVASAVRAAGWILGPDAHAHAAAGAAAAACLRRPDPWSCIAEILRDERIRRVAVVSIDPRPGGAGATDTVLSARLVISNVDSLFVAQRFCVRCTEARLAGLAGELTKELIDRAAVGSGRTVLTLRSTPRGARAYVDANLAGVTDTAIRVVPGGHTITVELEGYRTEARFVRIEEDSTQEVAFALRPAEPGAARASASLRVDAAAGASPPARRARLIAGAIAGVGLAAFAGGVVLFALDEDPVTAPGEEVPRRYRDTAARGVVLGVSGVAIAGIGGYLWWKYARASAAPVAAPAAGGGAVIGLTSSF